MCTLQGCTDPSATNYQPNATASFGGGGDGGMLCEYADPCQQQQPAASCPPAETCTAHLGQSSCTCIWFGFGGSCTAGFDELLAAAAGRGPSYGMRITSGTFHAASLLSVAAPNVVSITGGSASAGYAGLTGVTGENADSWFGLAAPAVAGGKRAELELHGLVLRGATTDTNGGAIEVLGGTVLVQVSHGLQLQSLWRMPAAAAGLPGAAVQGCHISHCASKGFGGVIWGNPDSVVTITGSEFVGNHAMQAGGAISSQGTVAVVNSRFVSNTAKYGGAIQLDRIAGQSGQLSLEGSAFLRNSALSDGGGGFSMDTGAATVNNCSFRSNRARGLDSTGGGAAYLLGSSLLVTNSSFAADLAGLSAGDELFLAHVTSSDIRQTGLSPFSQSKTIYSIGSAASGCPAHPCPIGMECRSTNGSITCTSCRLGQVGDGVSCSNCRPGMGPAAGGRSRAACAACVAGQYSDHGNCHACPSGHQPTAGQQACELSPCPVGRVPNADSTQCAACAEGTFTADRQLCHSCGGGSISSQDRTHCLCPAGTYNQSYGVIYCEDGDFDFDPDEDRGAGTALRLTCVGCPACANCTVVDGKTVVHVQEGYALTLHQAEGFEGLQHRQGLPHGLYGPAAVGLFSCPRPEECLGDQANSTDGSFSIRCRAGHTGPLCSVCQPDYAMMHGLCTECTDSGQTGRYVVFGLGLVVVAGLVGMLLRMLLLATSPGHGRSRTTGVLSTTSSMGDGLAGGGSSVENPASVGADPFSRPAAPCPCKFSVQDDINSSLHEVWDDIYSPGHLEDRSCLIRVRRIFRHFFHPVRIVISFGQVIVQLGPVLSVQYPARFQHIIDALRPIMFNIRNYVQIDCWQHHNFWQSWVFDVFCIPLLLFWVIGLYYLHMTVIRGHRSGVKKRNVIHSVRGYVFSVVFLVYPSICNHVFVVFRCRRLGPDEIFLEADYTVDCDSSTYTTFRTISAIYAFVVPFGVPVFFWRMMHREEKKESSTNPKLRRLCDRVATELELDGGAKTTVRVPTLQFGTLAAVATR